MKIPTTVNTLPKLTVSPSINLKGFGTTTVVDP